MRVQVDVLGIFRFVSHPPEHILVENFERQLETEFSSLYKVVPLRIDHLENGSNAPLEKDKVLQAHMLPESSVFAQPSTQWAQMLKLQPWGMLRISKEDFESRIRLLATIFGKDAKKPVLRSCLLRAAGDVSAAASVYLYLPHDILGSNCSVTFVRHIEVGRPHAAMALNPIRKVEKGEAPVIQLRPSVTGQTHPGISNLGVGSTSAAKQGVAAAAQNHLMQNGAAASMPAQASLPQPMPPAAFPSLPIEASPSSAATTPSALGVMLSESRGQEPLQNVDAAKEFKASTVDDIIKQVSGGETPAAVSGTSDIK